MSGEVTSLSYPAELPISSYRDEILAALRRANALVVCGDTGSGKTTQLPKMLLELGCGAHGRRIACTQPRRLAAVTVAERVADDLKSPVGGTVGWRHRFGNRTSDGTRIVFMTDGVLLAETRRDPLLRAYDAIIVDEAHERSLNVDFLLGILKRILTRRRDLKVVVSSATIDVGKFAAFFDGARTVSVPGRLFPITVAYRPPPPDEERDLPREVAGAVRELPPRDDILVFLPGERDIRETADRLSQTQPDDAIIPLLASLPAGEQQRAFRLSPKRRIVLATNVAETSVTIPGIRAVIDSGLARIARYIPRTQVQRLQIEPVSQASVRQRAGRCGRLGPGTCIRLYGEEDFNAREPFTPPEVLRASLAGVILTMLDLRLGDIAAFPFLDPPRPASVREGFRELLELGAVAHDERGESVLTAVGRRLARIPVEPRLARMLLAASDLATLPSALPVVAALSCDDPRRRPVDEREKATQAHAPFRVAGSDFLGTLALWRWWQDRSAALSQSKARVLAKKTYLSYPRMREWRDLTQQLQRLCQRLGLDTQNDNGGGDALHRALMTGLLARLGVYDPEAGDYRGAHGLRFALHPSSVLTKKIRGEGPGHPPWIMAGELVDTARLFARNAAAIDPRWIEGAAGALARCHCHSPAYDPSSGFVRATEQVTLYGLVIVPARRCDFSRYDPKLAREIFIRGALVDGAFPRPPPAVRANNALLDALRERADRERRPEFFDADRLFAHFAAVLPDDICSADAARRWLRREPPGFRLRKADWWPAADAPRAGFPDTIRVGPVSLRLAYRHAPDDPDRDGITCTVCRSVAAVLRDWRADWLVPGALPEKLAWMIAALPSAQRRVLSPVSDTVAGLMLHLKPGSEPLEDAVRRTVCEQWGIRIPSGAWAAAHMPPHLRVAYRIVDDETHRVCARSRDLEEALAQAGVAPAETPPREVAEKYADWSFGVLPETVSEQRAGWSVVRYPALFDEGDGVSIRSYAHRDAALRVHAAGVARLMLLALGPRAALPFKRRDLPIGAALYLRQMDYAPDRIAADILAGAVREVFVRNRPPVRDGAELARRLADGRNALVETQVEMARLVTSVADAAQTVAMRLDEDDRLPRDTAGDVATQLNWLVCRRFPQYVPLERLREFPRYLKGMLLRIERARNSPSSDRSKYERFAPHWARYERFVTAETKPPHDPVRLSAYRWALEEYRISLFAQELHTRESVSPKRLDEAWAAVLREEPA